MKHIRPDICAYAYPDSAPENMPVKCPLPVEMLDALASELPVRKTHRSLQAASIAVTRQDCSCCTVVV